MKKVAITHRVSGVPEYSERRDSLDQAWSRLLTACGLMAPPLPSVIEVATALWAGADATGLVLTGGNDLAALGGDAPERDATENALLELAESPGPSVLGVCRGMQMFQPRYAIPLRRVEGNVTRHQVIRGDGESTDVNCYPRFAAKESRPPLVFWAVADDGVVKAIRHTAGSTTGIMRHPERMDPFSAADVALFRRVFQVGPCAP